LLLSLKSAEVEQAKGEGEVKTIIVSDVRNAHVGWLMKERLLDILDKQQQQ